MSSGPPPDGEPRPGAGDPGRLPGLVFVVRLAPDGTFRFEAPGPEGFLELAPEEVGAMLTASRLPVLPDADPEFWASVRRSAADLTAWAREVRAVSPRTG